MDGDRRRNPMYGLWTWLTSSWCRNLDGLSSGFGVVNAVWSDVLHARIETYDTVSFMDAKYAAARMYHCTLLYLCSHCGLSLSSKLTSHRCQVVRPSWHTRQVEATYKVSYIRKDTA
jgi:hypothetical protein